MSSTPFSKKCEILKDFYMEYRDPSWAAVSDVHDIIRFYDLGFPAAMLVVDNAATLTDKGMQYVEDTWQGMCEWFGIDYLANYLNFDDVKEVSSYEEWQ